MKKAVYISIIMMIIISILTSCAVGTSNHKVAGDINKLTANKSSSTVSASSSNSAAAVTSDPVTVAVTGVTLDNTTVKLNVGGKVQLHATASPDNATDKTIAWSSTDRYNAPADTDGTVTANVAGTYIITATTSNGLKATCKVIVSDPNAPAKSSTAAPATTTIGTPISQTFHGAVFDGSRQIIVVTAKKLSDISGTFNTYQQQSNGTWNMIMQTSCCLGENGLVNDADRAEGDEKTPIGCYSLPYAFGTAGNPGKKMTFYGIDSNTFFDGQYGSATYDQFVEGKPNNNEWEQMNIPLYKYGVLINFNPEQQVGKGNAIFIHIYKYSNGVTDGCVAISETNIVSLLKWLDPAQSPKILICLNDDLSSYLS
jgi:L,D-peptidoglycan transpeptidase YkuD (ErfK/YbiS/YcfS/YnhG family)